MIFDFDVRMQIMNAMILALHFIHTSDLSYHGAFSDEVCLINNRYVLRVTHAGFLGSLIYFTTKAPSDHAVERLQIRLPLSSNTAETISGTWAWFSQTCSTLTPTSNHTKLRNHEPIIAEIFDSVTIMFSDIPAFGLIVAQSEPLEVIDFLNHLHTAFDRVVAQFDAYKVETINDSYVVRSKARVHFVTPC
ncbi:hypothetical protein BV898_08610 [Hypsibius exemplaris]|uniref:Guanylate cyclase domain-containing protein n=1 Tax=Hypsibius exemplaris TaxID=2072580 RepID=A0A1W0WQ75_HYPEX|nr:hypothetical protein BV898_08610 [Hypsibius exemplaris]